MIATAAAMAVSLFQAHQPPDYLSYLPAGRSVTVQRQCRHHGYWSDTSAYRWNGLALPAQRWNHSHDRTRWGHVTFDGVTFRNHFRMPVLVAGWCG